MISIVFPAYNEEENVAELHRLIVDAMAAYGKPYEIIAIENGSTDGTLRRLKELNPLTIIVLSRNFGQTAALDAGIHSARGEIVVTLDADLQNDPQDIPLLLKKLEEGYDCAAGWRRDRKDPLAREILSRVANWLTRSVTGIPLHDFACALKAFRKEYMQDVHLYGEMHVFLPAILHARGAKIAEVPVRHSPRRRGASKHYFMKAVKDIADLFTVKFLFSYAARPLVFFGGWGMASVALALVSAVWAVASTYAEGIHIIQSPFTFLAITFLVVGFILLMMGFMAEMLVRIYYEGRRMSPYVVSDIIENGKGQEEKKKEEEGLY